MGFYYKIFNFKIGIVMKGQKVCRQVRDQRSMATNKDCAQVLLENAKLILKHLPSLF